MQEHRTPDHLAQASIFGSSSRKGAQRKRNPCSNWSRGSSDSPQWSWVSQLKKRSKKALRKSPIPSCSSFLGVSGLPLLLLRFSSSESTASTSTERLGGPTKRWVVSPFQRTSGTPAKKLKMTRFRRSVGNCCPYSAHLGWSL